MISKVWARTGMVAGAFMALLALAGPAWAYWAVAVNGVAHGSASASGLGPPTVSTSGVTSTNVVISVTSAGTGPTPTGYRVARTAPTSASSVCTITGSTGSCNDTSPVPGQTNGYAVYAQLSSWEAAGANVATTSANVPSAAGTKFVITSAPVSGTAGSSATLGPLTVQRQDSTGTPVAPAAAVTVTLTSSSTGAQFSLTSGGTATSTATILASQSSTTFFYGDTKAGSPVITASGSLTSATQAETITPATASALAFVQQPSTTTAGASISPSVTVQVRDQFGNLTTSTASVTLAVGTNPGGGTLSGTSSRNAIAGTATFNDVSINKSGAGYTLSATSTGLTGAVSSSFTITAAAPDHLCITANPSCTGGTQAPLAPNSSTPSTVGLFDRFNNPTAAAAAMTVTLSLSDTSNNGSLSTGTLTIPSGQSVTSAQVTFTAAGSKNKSNTITAASPGVTSATWLVITT